MQERLLGSVWMGWMRLARSCFIWSQQLIGCHCTPQAISRTKSRVYLLHVSCIPLRPKLSFSCSLAFCCGFRWDPGLIGTHAADVRDWQYRASSWWLYLIGYALLSVGKETLWAADRVKSWSFFSGPPCSKVVGYSDIRRELDPTNRNF